MTVGVRFAPSPTGRLHVGNARVALVNWLFARKRGGSFLLRLDDTDLERSTREHAEAIERDMAWLGLKHDRFARQSDRMDRYALAIEKLKASERLYPCYETAEELDLRRRSRLARALPPIYDRAALTMSDSDRAKLEAAGKRPHWRFLLESGDVAWDDLVRGPCHFQGAHLSDPVLVREDGRPLYTLTSAVDDVELGIDHVIRGEDHVANTAVQIQLFQALGGPVPVFAHLPLLVDAVGGALSKRLGSLALEGLRAEGIEPMAVNSLLAHLGTADPVEPFRHLDDLVAGFDLARFGRAAPHFDPRELEQLNAKLLHVTPYAEVAPRLAAMGLGGAGERFWLAVRGNIQRLADVKDWWDVCQGAIRPALDDPDLTRAAADLLPGEPWDDRTWSQWTGAVAAATGRKGKALFMPLRRALTGRDHGPELKSLLPLIGRARAAARLTGKAA
ncbi:MAG: glutamate--tRNA ligase [Alphaproteobacteria bacterium]|nr:glutamate--tRNA ligase [Alphaproteobacteria bacterium]